MREIYCDESGYEGEKLIDTTTELFAHASVAVPDADAVLAELRARVRSPATQYKAGHLLRAKHHATLTWFLGPDGPMRGRGRVFLVDKAWLLALRTGELTGMPPAEVYARPPYHLAAANDVLRGKDRPGVVDEFVRVWDLPGCRERAELFRAWLRTDPVVNSVLDPLVPAIVAAVHHWSTVDGGGAVIVAHDRQIMLPPARVDRVRELCAGRLAGMRLRDAQHQPQIQVADMLAGTVRALATRMRAGRTGNSTADVIRPYVDETSILPATRKKSQ
ncbi:NAD-dependent protein deacetylase of SIR2 family [Mangrovihabitans endophyticus]|uniref:DUF3800 domain-containing protein n=1 Tax=Mangrovihabitans endophyticus TaxID=1751298 RepID=A0A8J3FNI7_9ACTN|nr:NAD-dependent protein deacetylase of SIR2 family [Mangrovihabitans endophyticus]GGK84480.1 hypothetical protein GCM10012284_18380 [Mangrovihabitans endophyticus]